MNKIIVFLLLNASFHMFGQENYALNAPIKTMYADFRSEGAQKTTETFKLIGPVKKVSSKRVRKGGYQEVTELHVFSESGNLSLYMFGDSMSSDKSYQVFGKEFTYDQDDVLTFVLRSDYDSGKRITSYKYNYDSKGFLTSAKKYKYHGSSALQNHLDYIYTWQDSVLTVKKLQDYEFDIRGYSQGDSLKFTFNSQNQLINEIAFHFFGTYSFSFSYDSLGNRYLSSEINRNGGSGNEREYDSLNNVIYVAKYHSGIDHIGNYYNSSKSKFEYNENNFLSSIWGLHSQTYDGGNPFIIYTEENLEQEPDVFRLEQRLEYEYDSYGNWIEKKTFDGSDQLTGTETREIIYY